MSDIRDLYENLFSSVKLSFSRTFQGYFEYKTAIQVINLHPGVPFLYWLLNTSVSLDRTGTEWEYLVILSLSKISVSYTTIRLKKYWQIFQLRRCKHAGKSRRASTDLSPTPGSRSLI